MISEFKDSYRFLSNFWPSEVTYEGMTYRTVEHAFVAAKTTDIAKRRVAQQQPTASMAKRYGRSLELRHDWNDIRLSVMAHLIYEKFSKNASLKAKLLATGDEYLQEGNTWNDTFWGVCRGKGANHLGKILMQVREQLREQKHLEAGNLV